MRKLEYLYTIALTMIVTIMLSIVAYDAMSASEAGAVLTERGKYTVNEDVIYIYISEKPLTLELEAAARLSEEHNVILILIKKDE